MSSGLLKELVMSSDRLSVRLRVGILAILTLVFVIASGLTRVGQPYIREHDFAVRGGVVERTVTIQRYAWPNVFAPPWVYVAVRRDSKASSTIRETSFRIGEYGVHERAKECFGELTSESECAVAVRREFQVARLVPELIHE